MRRPEVGPAPGTRGHGPGRQGAPFPRGRAGKGFLRTRKWYKARAKRSVHEGQENSPVTQR